MATIILQKPAVFLTFYRKSTFLIAKRQRPVRCQLQKKTTNDIRTGCRMATIHTD